MLVEAAVDGTGMVPVEAVESGEFAEGGEARQRQEVAALALAALHLDEFFADLDWADAALGGVFKESAQRGQ